VIQPQAIQCFLAFAILFSPTASAQRPHEEILRSGRKIKVLGVTEIEIKEQSGQFGPRALWLDYETEMKDPDEISLRREVQEVWVWIKVDTEHRGLREAIINVSLARGNARNIGKTQFVFQKQPDRSWKD
jgi:hypothetical protein